MGIKFTPIILIIIIIGSVVVVANFTGINLLSITNPAANIIFVPNQTFMDYSHSRMKFNSFTEFLGPFTGRFPINCSNLDLACPAFKSTDTNLFTPPGLFVRCFDVTNIGLVIGNFCVKMPSDAPGACMGSNISGLCYSTNAYGFSGSTQPEVLLNPGSSYWEWEASTFPAYDPVTCPLNNYCNPYVITKEFDGTPVTYPNGTIITPVTVKQIWIYRMFTSVFLQLNPSISVVCNPNFQYFFGGSCRTGSENNDNFRIELASAIQDLNGVAMLDNMQIELQLNVPGAFYDSSTDWFGIFGAWLGSGWGSIGVSGNCNTQTCSLAQTANSNLGLWSDPDLNIGASFVAGDLPNLSSYSGDQLAALLPENVYNRIYTNFDITKFGSVYDISNSCNIASFQSCVIAIDGGTKTMTVPIVYDIIGSKSDFYYRYKYPTPIGDCVCGNVKGRLVNAGAFWHPAITNALITIDAPPGTTPAQGFSTQPDVNGNFLLEKIPAGGHTIYVTADGFTHYQRSILVVNQEVYDLGEVPLNPLVSWADLCLIPPIPNPVPGLPNLFNGLCINIFVLFGLVALGVLVIVFLLGGAPLVGALGARGAIAIRGVRGLKK